jgi:hypothetical protein
MNFNNLDLQKSSKCIIISTVALFEDPQASPACSDAIEGRCVWGAGGMTPTGEGLSTRTWGAGGMTPTGDGLSTRTWGAGGMTPTGEGISTRTWGAGGMTPTGEGLSTRTWGAGGMTPTGEGLSTRTKSFPISTSSNTVPTCTSP